MMHTAYTSSSGLRHWRARKVYGDCQPSGLQGYAALRTSTAMTRMTPSNCYDDRARAEAYARLEFANTYHLAFRDLPTIFAEHVKGSRALDFGCGTGRSTRFLRRLGFKVTGIDIAPPMIAKAREMDAAG